MKKLLRYSVVALLAMIGLNVNAQEAVIDFSGEDNWGIGTEQITEAKSFTYNGLTIKLTPSEGNYFRWYDTGNILLGKNGATLEFPAFDFDVERIDIVGTSGASAAVKQNIFVGDEAVSNETTGAKDVTNQYEIAADKQAAGTLYTLKVTSNHNTQITKILIWKKGTGGDVTHIANTPETAYNIEDCVKLIEAGQSLSEKVYVKGFITNIEEVSTNYGNATFKMATNKGDKDAEYKLKVFRAYYLNNEKFTAEDQIKENDEVIVYGQLQLYNGEGQLTSGYIYSLTSSAEEQGQVWDFTKWSDTTVAALLADAAASKTSGWSDVEKAADAENNADPTEASKDNCFWSVAEPNEDGTISANGVVISELKGLVWNKAYTIKRSLAIAVNYPKALSEYAGPAYLWLGGGKQKLPCFTIPGVKAGSTITMEVESHKTSDARGVELYTGLDADGLVDAATKIGDSFTPTTKDAHTWTIESDCDVIVYNTNGCHIYKITVAAGDPASITTVKENSFVNAGIFNLAGQRLEKAQKGLNIINGKKVVIK